MKAWVKLYTEINRDPDMGTLTWEQRGIWSALMALCGEIDIRDENENETGATDTPEKIAWHLRTDMKTLQPALDAFQERGFIEITDGVVFLIHYPPRQQRAPSSKPSEVEKRVARHRELKRQQDEKDATTADVKRDCNEDVTSLQRGVTPSDTEEKREEKRRAVVVTPGARNEFVAQSIRAYESTIGVLGSERQSEEIRETLLELQERGLESWWQTAIEIAVDANKRRWDYMRAILENHLRDGTAPSRARGSAPPPKPTKQVVKVVDPITGGIYEREAII